jgi:hypothetical protein
MSVQKVLAILGLCAMLILCIGIFADLAHAQDTKNAAKKVDKNLAKKQGVKGALAKGKKEEEKAKPATPVQMAIGVGSIFVMIAVVKWL